MAKQQKEVHKVKMADGKRAIIQQLFQEYDIESTSDIQDALKDLLGGTIKEISFRLLYNTQVTIKTLYLPILKQAVP